MEKTMPNSGQNPYHENEGTSEQKMRQMWAWSQKWRMHDGDGKGMNDKSTNIPSNHIIPWCPNKTLDNLSDQPTTPEYE